MDGIIVKMDIRGFIRFPAEAIRTMKLDKMAKQTTGPRAT